MYHLFHISHIVFLFLLTGITFAAFASPTPENRKRFLMYGGICSMAVLITGFGLLGVMKLGFPGWLLVKLVCWLALSAAAGLAFRVQEKTGFLVGLTTLAIALAVTMVSVKPMF